MLPVALRRAELGTSLRGHGAAGGQLALQCHTVRAPSQRSDPEDPELRAARARRDVPNQADTPRGIIVPVTTSPGGRGAKRRASGAPLNAHHPSDRVGHAGMSAKSEPALSADRPIDRTLHFSRANGPRNKLQLSCTGLPRFGLLLPLSPFLQQCLKRLHLARCLRGVVASAF